MLLIEILSIMALSMMTYVQANDCSVTRLERLKNAYPDHIYAFTEHAIIWVDGTSMELGVSDPHKSMQDKLDYPTLADQLEQAEYITGVLNEPPHNNSGRVRYEPFFKKMYGDSPQAVQRNLEKIIWMPTVFKEDAHYLWVTKVNNVHHKIQEISDQLEKLVFEHPDYIFFLANPGGTYCWRVIANTNRLSAHSFGMTLDINAQEAQYWQWDLKAENRQISEQEELVYRNTVPWEIVEIFENQGFIWGGKMYHYDTMHFEYRPELIVGLELSSISD